MRIKPARWAFNPAQVDPAWRWFHQRLLFGAALWERGGVPRDLVSRVYANVRKTGVGASDPTWVATRYGPGRNSQHNNTNINYGEADDWGDRLDETLGVADFTVFSMFILEGGHTNINALLVKRDADSDLGTGWWLGVNSFNTDDRKIRFALEGAGGGEANSASGLVVTDQIHTAIGRRSGTTIDVWLDGVQRASTGSVTISLDTTAKLFSGGFEKGAGQENVVAFGLDGTRLLEWVVQGALSDSEIIALSLDPFGPFRQQQRRWGLKAAPTTGDILTQHSYRWRLDDGSESAATWADAIGTPITVGVGAKRRLRFLVNATGNPDPTAFQLEFKKKTDPDVNYKKVPVK